MEPFFHPGLFSFMVEYPYNLFSFWGSELWPCISESGSPVLLSSSLLSLLLLLPLTSSGRYLVTGIQVMMAGSFLFFTFFFLLLPVLCLSFSPFLSFFLSTLRFGGQVCECVPTVNQKSQRYLCPGIHTCISDLTIFVPVS